MENKNPVSAAWQYLESQKELLNFDHRIPIVHNQIADPFLTQAQQQRRQSFQQLGGGDAEQHRQQNLHGLGQGRRLQHAGQDGMDQIQLQGSFAQPGQTF